MANYKLKELIVPGSSDVYDIDAKYIAGTSPSTYVHNNMKEAYLTWGGTNLAGNITPIDMATSNIHSANRLAFAKPAGITIEYLRSGGSWTDYGASDTTKISLVSGLGAVLSIGNRTSGTAVGDKLRLTLTASKMSVYTRMEKILLNISTNYATGSNVVVERSLIGSETTFSTVGTYALSGWSGWNSIPYSAAFGGNSSQTSQTASLRFTFGITGVNADTSKSSALQLLDIAIFGSTYWNYPSTLAKTGHIYSYDSSQNATFPANITATKFKGNLEGNADTATKVATTYENNASSKYDLLAAPVNSDTYDSIYKNSNLWVIPNKESFTDPNSGKEFNGGTTVIIGSTPASSCWTEYDNSYYDEEGTWIEDLTTEFESYCAGTGHLEVAGNLIVGGGSDEYGIFPAQSNYSKIGDSNHYWYEIHGTRIFGTMIYQGGTQVINTITEDGITGYKSNGSATITRYGACSTAASTAAKTVSITKGNFALGSGARVTVKFTYANTASNPTLDVNSKGAKNIYHKGARITTGTNKALLAGVCDFVYDGTQWHLVGNYIDSNTNTTLSGIAYCSTAASTAAKTATMPGFALSSGQRIFLRTTATNSATSSVTLNVNSTGAKPIKIGNTSTDPTASNFPAGDYIANYDGTNWVLTRIYLTDTNTWRGIQDNLTSTSTTDSLSANQGKVLKGLVDGKVTANTAVTGATKCKITYDSKGLVTAGADLAAADIPALAASKITSGTFDVARIPSLASSKITAMTGYSKADTASAIAATDSLNTAVGKLEKALDGKLSTGGGTVTGTVTFSRTQDLSGTADNKPALIIGGTNTGTHLEIDCNEIHAKTNGTSAAQLYINNDGGCTNFGGGILVKGNIVGQVDSTGYATISGFTSVSAGSFTATSDKRLKENIQSYTCNKSILDLDVKKFDFVNGEKNQIGCLAQDLQEICPEMVVEDKNGYLGIKESKLVYLLLQELKNQKEEIAYLKKELSNLK